MLQYNILITINISHT